MTRHRNRRGGPKPIRNAWEPIIKDPDNGISDQERQTAKLQTIALLDAACDGDQQMRLYLTPGPHVHDMALMLAQMTELAVALTRLQVGFDPGAQRQMTDQLRNVVLHGQGV